MEPTSGKDLSIAMWGPPGSGKTTFLAALDVALARQDTPWRLIGADEASTSALVTLTSDLTRAQQFPAATQGLHRLRWQLRGAVEERHGLLRRRTRSRPASIRLELVDAPGEAFADDTHRRSRDTIVRALTESRGLIFLFDPIREFDEGDTFNHLHGVLAHLAHGMNMADELWEAKLPHYLAVCITKFDDVRMLETARRMGLLTVEPDDPFKFPRVSDEDAPELFETLCELSPSGGGSMVVSMLNRFFLPDRVRYFVTSSIGFHVAAGRTAFDPDDYQNLIPDREGYPRLRGQVHPINVMEPLLWLAQNLAAES